MSRDWLLYLEDILEACRRITRYTRGLTQKRFLGDVKTFDATIRNLEIIGEAAKHLPDHVLAQIPEVEWRKAAGLRDHIAHAYFGLDPDILWDAVKVKMPELQNAVSAYLKRVSKQP